MAWVSGFDAGSGLHFRYWLFRSERPYWRGRSGNREYGQLRTGREGWETRLRLPT